MKSKICPSLLSSDLSNLASETKKMIELGVDYIHLDVMDGHFVSNFTIGPPVIGSLRKNVSGFFDVHLMIENPGKWIKRFVEAGSDSIGFHIEACEDEKTVLENLKMIKASNCLSALAISPATKIPPYVTKFIDMDLVDMVLIMTVVPGYGGQKFMEEPLEKVRFLRKKYPKLDIQVDGGVNNESVKLAAEAGANVIVCGSFLLKSKDPGKVVNTLREEVDKVVKK